MKKLNYHEIFSIVMKLMNYKIIFVIVAANDWNIEQMNVKTIFLYDEINEKMYVKILHDYTDDRKIYCRFWKTLYELKQSSRIWSNTLTNYLKKHDFLFFDADQSVFNNDKIIIAIYVDDLLIAELDKKFIRQIKKILHKRFQMIDINFFAYYLNMKITKNKQQRTLHFNQKIYLKKIIRDHDMWKFNAMSIFMNNNIKLTIFDVEYICFFDEKLRYQSIVESLMYAMFDTRLDIIYVVSAINRYASNFNNNHWTVVKKIFRYFRHSLDLRFIFFDFLQSLVDYTNVDWVDDKNTRRFIFDYIFNFESAVINWSSKRQVTVALSTCEIEYMNQTQTIKKIIWLFNLLNELKFSNMINVLFVVDVSIYCFAITIFCDNQSAQTFAKNFIFHARNKHIDIQQHFVKNKIQNETFDLQHVFNNDQIANDFIKSLSKNKFFKFRRDIDLI